MSYVLQAVPIREDMLTIDISQLQHHSASQSSLADGAGLLNDGAGLLAIGSQSSINQQQPARPGSSMASTPRSRYVIHSVIFNTLNY